MKDIRMTGGAGECPSTPALTKLADEIKTLKTQVTRNAHTLAEIGDRLIQVKHQVSPRCWLPWLRQAGIEFSRHTANNYMALAQVRKRFGPQFDKLVAGGLRTLYQLNGSTDELTPERVSQMTPQELAATLHARRSKPRTAKSVSSCPPLGQGATTRDAFAQEAIERLTRLAAELMEIGPREGKLTPQLKAQALEATEKIRRAVLAWPAYTPTKTTATADLPTGNSRSDRVDRSADTSAGSPPGDGFSDGRSTARP